MVTLHNQYQRLVENGRMMIENAQQHWHEYPVERYPIAYFGMALDGLCIAVGSLMLGQVEEARSWFRQAARYYLQSDLLAPDTVVSSKRALECALLSGDWELCRQAAEQIPLRAEKNRPKEYPYAMVLKYTILGDSAAAHTFAVQAAAVNAGTLKKQGGYGTLGSACVALANREASAFKTALEALLREHKLKAAHGRANMPDGILCLPGAALLILARREGMVVEVKSDYLPDDLAGQSAVSC